MLGNWYVNSKTHNDGTDVTGGMHKGQRDRKDWTVISGKLENPYMILNIRYLYSNFYQI
jgi:hypothetical protein